MGLFSHESHFQPETAVNKEQDTILNASVPVPTLVNSAAGAAGSLAGWAISSISKKVFSLVNSRFHHIHFINQLAVSDMQAPIPGSQLDRSNGVTNSLSLGNHIGEITRPTFKPTEQSLNGTPTAHQISKGKALQLGGGKKRAPILADQLAEEAAAIPISAGENPWGTDDLIDIAADDDWGWLQCHVSNIILTLSQGLLRLHQSVKANSQYRLYR
jgi:SCY1-like protein 1